MLRKILLVLALLFLAACGGLFALFATDNDILLSKFHSYVENSTGAPLLSESVPRITLFPNRGLELAASSWQSPDGALSIKFSHASVMISSHELFTGRFSIKNCTVDDLDLTIRLKKDLSSHLKSIPSSMEHRRDFDELIQAILEALRISPDNISISRGRICLIQPDGSEILFTPFSLSATNIHPGAATKFKLLTNITSSAPSFSAGVELDCSALLDKKKAQFSMEKAMLTPGQGVSFKEYLNLSGEMKYDFDSDALTLSRMHFQGPDLSATASGSIDSLAQMYRSPKQGDASLKVEVKGDPQRLSAILHHPLPFADHTIFTDCSFSSEMRWSGGKMRMSSIQGKADELTFEGKLDITATPFDIRGELKFGSIDLDAYRRSGGSPQNIEERDFSRWPKVDLQLSAEHIRWNRLHLESTHARLTGRNGSYEFNPVSGILAGSPVTASVKSVLLPTSPLSSRLMVNMSIPQGNLDELSRAIAQKSLLKGSGAINASLSFTSSRGLPSLNGKGTLTSSGVETSFSILPGNIPFASSLLPSRNFDRLFFSFRVQDGLLSIDSFSLDAPRLSLSGTGTANLIEKTVNASGAVQMPGSTALPVTLSGSLSSPQYSLKKDGEKSDGKSKPMRLDIDIPGKIRNILQK